VRSLKLVVPAVVAAVTALAPAAPAGAAAAPTPHSEWWLSSWGIDKIWPITQGKGVTVAVLDTGVNARLSDLAGSVLPGGDMTGGGTDGRTDTDTRSGGHGTAMTALIVGKGRSTGVLGVAPQARVLPVTIGNGAATAGDFHVRIAKGIRYAVDHGAKVISISQAFPAGAYPESCPTDVLDSVAYAARHDVVIAAATGDDGGVGNPSQAPASCPGVLAVGAVDAEARPWRRTQQVSYTAVAGPGGAVGWVGKDGRPGQTGSGTSQATALTAGGLALVRAANPGMSAREVVRRAMATALDSGPPGRDDQTGYGAFRIHRTMDLGFTVPSGAPNPPYERLDRVVSGGRAPSASPSASGRAAEKENRSGGSSIGPMVGVVVLFLVVVLVMALIIARRRPLRGRPPNEPTPGGDGTPQSFGRPDRPDPGGH
jgi:subtilisin family serine protease